MVAAAVAALALPRVARADDPKIKFEKYTLPNGLEVILAPDPSVPLVAVNLWYHVGSGDEVHGKSGFAHLFEHMMFQGSKNVGTDKHFPTLRKIGSDEINGTTNSDRTNYFEVVPANQLATALWLESDRMGHLLDILDKDELANQIDVVRNERRQRYDNVPYTPARFAMLAALYPEGHPYRYMTIGKHEDLVNASVDDVKNFFKTWYVPSNATLALVGDFDPADAKALVQKWFGTFPTSVKPKVVTVPAPTISSSTVTVDDSLAKLRQVTFAWHSPASYAPGDAELDIAASALGEEGAGRLFKSLVYDKQLAQSVRVGQSGSTFSGVFTITVTLRSGSDLAAIEQIVADEVAKISREPLADKEVARVVAAQESRAIYRLEGLNSRANQLQEYNQFLGDPDRISFDLDRYRKATADQIRATVAQWLSPQHEVIIVTNPVAKAGAK
jgi:zinc protease